MASEGERGWSGRQTDKIENQIKCKEEKEARKMDANITITVHYSPINIPTKKTHMKIAPEDMYLHHLQESEQYS